MMERALSYQLAHRLYETDPDEDHPASITKTYWIQRVLSLLAEVAQEPSITNASVYPHSQIGDYLMSCWLGDQQRTQYILSVMQTKIGFQIKDQDLITDTANKIRN